MHGVVGLPTPVTPRGKKKSPPVRHRRGRFELNNQSPRGAMVAIMAEATTTEEWTEATDTDDLPMRIMFRG